MILSKYKATKRTDGSYRVTIKASEHGGHKGTTCRDAILSATLTIVIIFLKSSFGWLRSTKWSLPDWKTQPSENFDAVVSIIVKINWSKRSSSSIMEFAGGQDDLIWHKATRQADAYRDY